MTSTFKHPGRRDHILNHKMIGMKFNRNIIIMSKFMNRQQVFRDFRNVKDVIKNKGFSSGINKTLTNMFNVQTLSIADVDPLVAIVFLLDSKAVKIAGDMVSSPGVGVPICI